MLVAIVLALAVVVLAAIVQVANFLVATILSVVVQATIVLTRPFLRESNFLNVSSCSFLLIFLSV